MRGRIGGRIGASSSPAFGGTSGVWRLADVYAAKSGAYGEGTPSWPTRNLTIAWPSDGYYGPPIDYADATVTGSATFNANVSGDGLLNGVDFSFYWERSTDAGATWTTVSGSSGSFTLDSSGTAVSLTRTGQALANDGDRYRLVVVNGLKNITGPTGTMRFDTVTLTFPNFHTGEPSFGFYDNGAVVSATKTVSVDGWVFMYAGVLVSGQTYGANYTPTVAKWQTSTDGGTTWTDGTGVDDQDPSEEYVYFAASSSDNGRKWRYFASFNSQSVTSRVATLTVT